MGDHLAGPVVQRDQRGREAAAQRIGMLAHEPLEVGLDPGIDRQAVHEAGLVLAEHGVGQVRGEDRELAARGRHALGRGAARLVGRDDVMRRGMSQHPVAGAQRGLREAVRPAQLRRLRQGDEQGRLGQRQAPRLLTEVGERGGAHALQVAAEGRKPQVEAQDRVLGELALEMQGAQRLAHFAGAGALVLTRQQARHLHGQRRAAGDDAAMADELPAGAADGDGVDAAVAAETPVLEGEQHGEVAWVDLLGLDGQTPAAVGCGVGAQQAVVAVEHADGKRLGTRERERLHALPDEGDGARGEEQYRDRRAQ